jgi:hypothetical protein
MLPRTNIKPEEHKVAGGIVVVKGFQEILQSDKVVKGNTTE